MITKAQFCQLKGGDILMMRSGAIRTVLEGPLDLIAKRGPWQPSVSFTKINRGLFGPTTVYFWADMHFKIKAVIGKCKGVCLKSEVLRLKQMGFDPRREFQRKVAESRKEASRRGWKLCGRIRQLKV